MPPGLNLRCWDIFTPDDQSFPGCYTESSTTNGCMDSCFTLDRFSDDHTRAFFKPGENSSEEGFLFRRLHEKQLVGDPIFSIQVREVVNDTGLPELQIDDDEDEISFDWRGMLDQLMGEEHVFNTILSQRLGWYLEPGDDAVNILETHRKLARRSRYQRECRAKYETNILNHYVNGEAQALKSLSHLRLAASGSNSVHDDDKKNNKKKKKDPNVYTKQEILDELPDDAVIYSGNSDPSPEPGSIPRGIFTSQDYCWYNSSELPPPSTMDLFSQRPLPDLSWGRRRLDSVPRMKRKLGLSQGKRAREEEQGVLPAKRGKNATG